MTIDLFANFGQFVYDDNNPENPLGAPTVSGGRRVPENDAYLFGWQLGAKFNFTKTIYFQLAPTIYNYSGTGTTLTPSSSAIRTFRRHGASGDRHAEPDRDKQPAHLRHAGWSSASASASCRSASSATSRSTSTPTIARVAAGHPDKDDERYAYQIGVGHRQASGPKTTGSSRPSGSTPNSSPSIRTWSTPTSSIAA